MGIKETLLDGAWRVSCWAHKYTDAASPRPSRSEQLRTILRKHPTWRLGHLELGEESLLSDDIASAYASAQVVLHLESDDSQSPNASRASFLLGRCYLRRGDAKRALQFFTTKCTDPSLLWKIKEECAAAYMLCGDLETAFSTLSSVPHDALTPEGAAAKEYLTKRQEGSLTSNDYSSPFRRGS